MHAVADASVLHFIGHQGATVPTTADQEWQFTSNLHHLATFLEHKFQSHHVVPFESKWS